MPHETLCFQTIGELGRQLRTGALTPVELAEAFLARARALDGALHAFVEVYAERALAQARAAEILLRSGADLGPLHGIPYVAKDLFDVRGVPTQAGTRLLAGTSAPADSAAVERLSRAGAVLLGKTHTVQFAFGGVGINHDLGTPHNPWARTPLAPGGSSSGTGVAVGAGMAPAGLGTDTGGSVRIPAALCGTVGLKTTVGRVSRAGVYPLSRALDSVGPLARSVEDAALVYAAVAGPDPRDEPTLGVGPGDPLVGLGDGVRGLRLAFGETAFFDDLDPEVENAVREAGEVFRSLGARVESVEIPEVGEVLGDPRRPLMLAAEACAANREWIERHPDRLDPVVARRMVKGRELRAEDYVAVAQEWAVLRRRVLHTLRDVDAVLAPTTPVPALPLAEIDATPETYAEHNGRYLRNTTVGNVLNLCAVSLPCGFTRRGLPVGLMIYARPFCEAMALRVARAFEAATEWHKRRPDLSWAR